MTQFFFASQCMNNKNKQLFQLITEIVDNYLKTDQLFQP